MRHVNSIQMCNISCITDDKAVTVDIDPLSGELAHMTLPREKKPGSISRAAQGGPTLVNKTKCLCCRLEG